MESQKMESSKLNSEKLISSNNNNQKRNNNRKKENNFNVGQASTRNQPTTSAKTVEKNNQKSRRSYNAKKGLTPYQGNKQCFGYFNCKKCNNEWTSDCSYADSWHPCKKCKERVYPYKQRPLTKKEYDQHLESIEDTIPLCDCEMAGMSGCKHCCDMPERIIMVFVREQMHKLQINPRSRSLSE